MVSLFALVLLVGIAGSALGDPDPVLEWLRGRDQHFAEHPELVGKSGTGYNPYARARWFLEQRMVDGALPEGDARLKVWEDERGRVARTGDSWFSVGPSNFGGRLLSMTFDPGNSQRIYAGAAGGGLWRTDDAGASWEPLTDTYPFIAIGGVAVKPGDPTRIIVGTGQGQPGGNAVDGIGVWRSLNGGSSWQSTSLHHDRDTTNGFYFVKYHPNASVVFAGSQSALSRSVDDGATWTTVLGVGCTDIALLPGSPVALAIQGRPATGAGIYRSTDGGTSWTAVHNPSSCGRGRVAFAPSDPTIAYALLGHSDGDGLRGVFRSDDGGATWAPVNADYSLTSGGQSSMHQALAIHPDDPDLIIVGGVNLMRSSNGGVDFERLNDAIGPHVDYLGAIWDPVTPDLLWIWGDGGVWQSPDNGDTWVEKSTDLRNIQLYDVGTSVASATVDVLFGGAQDNGVERRDPGDTTWDVVFAGDGTITVVHSTDPDIVFATKQRGLHLRSLDGGSSFDFMYGGLPGGDAGPFVTPKVADPSNPEVLFTTTTTELYRSTAASTCDADCWSPVDNSGRPAVSLSVSPADGNVVWALMQDGTVRKSADGGSSFAPVTTPTASGEPTCIAAHPSSAAVVFATFSGYGTGAHVVRSPDGGTTWLDMTGNLPDAPVNTIAIPSDVHAIYVGTDVGVHATTDGVTWAEYGSDLPFTVVTDLEIHEASGTLVAATYGRGAWVTTLMSMLAVDPDVVTSAGNLLLAPPAPNPVEGEARIRYAAHASSPVTLDVFDVNGRRVTRVTELATGDGEVHEAIWRTDSVPAGVYLLRLRAGGREAARRVTVVK